MRAPAKRIADQGSGADQSAAVDRDEAVDPPVLDRAKPRSNDSRMRQVASKEEQVVFGKVFCKSKHRIAVGRFEAPDLVAHVDLSPSHSTSFGHSRLIALPPATKLTCPPFIVTCSLSTDPTIPISGAEAADGTM